MQRSLVVLLLFVLTAIASRGAILYVDASATNPVPPYASWSTAATNIQDALDDATAGDEVDVANGLYATALPAGSFGLTVNQGVLLQSVNGPQSTFVDCGGTNAGANLADDALLSGFTLTNGRFWGVYSQASNAVVSNCVIAGFFPVEEGPFASGAQGVTLYNCVLSNNTNYGYGGGAANCTLSNCTLIGNRSLFTTQGRPTPCYGGGAYNCVLTNCTLVGNYCYMDGGGAGGSMLLNCLVVSNSCQGGGAGCAGCTVNNSTLAGNYSDLVGGGAAYSTLDNCLVVSNSCQDSGGGCWGCTNSGCTLIGNSDGADGNQLNNCIVYDNIGLDYYPQTEMDYCCVPTMPTNGVGNITNAPLFVDPAGGNFRLQANSPCINAGNDAYVVGSTDLDGDPRIVGGTVDIGAYEYQTPVSMISYAWLQQYGLPISTNVDATDPDGSGMNAYQDWIAGLNPTNALSVLKMTSAAKTNNPAGLVVTWESVNTRTYYLQSSTNLAGQPAFSTVRSNIVGQAGTTSYTDTTATNAGPYFYRVGVRN